MKLNLKTITVLLALLTWGGSLHLMGQETRTLSLIEDYDQKYMCSRVFELKNIKSADITPFIDGSIKRYNTGSNIQRLNYKPTGRQFILVNTGVDMMPYVVDMVAKLDRPCAKKDANNSIVDGDGIYKYTYRPKYRGTENMKDILGLTLNNGVAYFDQNANLFYWKDSKSHGELFLEFLKALDRRVPQVTIALKVYEMNDNEFVELGVDYINWKNGPGASLLGVGYDWTNFTSSENMSSWTNSLNVVSKGPASSLGGIGGFMIAPQFDATFLRMLEQKGKAKVATSGSITVINDASSDPGPNNYSTAKYRLKFVPSVQSIKKDSNQNATIDAFAESIYFYLRKPTIGFNDDGTKPATIQFGWVLNIENTVEKTNTGSPVINQQFFSSWLTIATGSEKLIGTYTKEHLIKQTIGMPYLADIPGAKYLFGTSVDSKTHSRVFITTEITDVPPDHSLSEWAGKVISASEIVKGE